MWISRGNGLRIMSAHTTATELGVPARASGSSGLPDHLITYLSIYLPK